MYAQARKEREVSAINTLASNTHKHAHWNVERMVCPHTIVDRKETRPDATN